MARPCPAAFPSRLLAFALPCLVSPLPRASAQDVLLDIASPSPQAQAEYAIPIGDWDGDGTEDLAIGAPNDSSVNQLNGAVRIHSGVDGRVIAKRTPFRLGARLGYPLARLPDVNGDGVADLAVAAPYFDHFGPSKGSIFIVAGGTNQLLVRIDPAQGATWPLVPVGDVDGDGICDIATSYGGAIGRVYIHSCADGHEIAHFDGVTFEYFGATISALDDLDGDGVQELLVGAPFHENSAGVEVGAAFVISPATGSVLRTHEGTFQDELVGRGSTTLSDLDGDGVREYAVIAGNDGVGTGSMFFVYSGATGAVLANVLSPSSDANFNSKIFDAGDVNGDGIPDVVIDGTRRDSGSNQHGVAFVFSGRTWLELGRIQVDDDFLALGPSLDLNRDGLSDLVIGTSEASLDGRVRVFSGDDFWLTANPPVAHYGTKLELATAEGVPGGLTILTLESIDGVPTFQLVNGVGTLDAAGHRVVSNTIPAGLAGHTMEFRAYAKDALGRVIQSTLEEVRF